MGNGKTENQIGFGSPYEISHLNLFHGVNKREKERIDKELKKRIENPEAELCYIFEKKRENSMCRRIDRFVWIGLIG